MLTTQCSIPRIKLSDIMSKSLLHPSKVVECLNHLGFDSSGLEKPESIVGFYQILFQRVNVLEILFNFPLVIITEVV